MQYLAMERVDLPTVESWINDASSIVEQQSRTSMASQGVANALSWLFNLSVPLDAHIGLIEGTHTLAESERVRARSGCTHHAFFGDSRAPFRYTSAIALQQYINTA